MNIRVGVYVEPNNYRRLKAMLALKGKSISQWLREKIQEEIQE